MQTIPIHKTIYLHTVCGKKIFDPDWYRGFAVPQDIRHMSINCCGYLVPKSEIKTKRVLSHYRRPPITGKQRDQQRSRVYKAENAVPGWPGKQFESLKEVDNWVKRIMAGKTWTKHFQRTRPILVKDGRGRRRASGGNGRIVLQRWARSQMVVLHEIAHVLTSDQHGPRFCDTYLNLVSRYLGKETGEALRLAFVNHNVTYYKP